MPPESLSTRVSRRSTRFAISAPARSPRRRSARPIRYRCAKTSRFCSHGQRRVEVVELRDDAAFARGPASTRAGRRNPSTSISPSSAIDWAVRIRIVVDLPAPFGPEQPDARADRDVEVEVVDRRDRAVALDDAAQADGELVAHPPSMPAAGYWTTAGASLRISASNPPASSISRSRGENESRSSTCPPSASCGAQRLASVCDRVPRAVDPPDLPELGAVVVVLARRR